MKKNIAMRVAAFLFILTMISTCAFATTFAKYTTSGTANDEARVAKWGVVLNVQGNGTAFSTAYDAGEASTVESSNQQKVVAPGTEGSLFAFSIEGQPEVDAQVKIELEMNLENWTVTTKEGSKFYCPLEIDVDGIVIKGTDYSSATDFIAKIAETIQAGVHTFEAKEEIDYDVTVSWKWAFTGNDDAFDTQLGNAANTVDYPSIDYTITVTVEQIGD